LDGCVHLSHAEIGCNTLKNLSNRGPIIGKKICPLDLYCCCCKLIKADETSMDEKIRSIFLHRPTSICSRRHSLVFGGKQASGSRQPMLHAQTNDKKRNVAVNRPANKPPPWAIQASTRTFQPCCSTYNRMLHGTVAGGRALPCCSCSGGLDASLTRGTYVEQQVFPRIFFLRGSISKNFGSMTGTETLSHPAPAAGLALTLCFYNWKVKIVG
jgi:hypothetical protein